MSRSTQNPSSPDPQSDRIGFIGLGAMGVGMAANLVRAGYPVCVMGHSRREPVDRLVSLGASEVDTPAAVAAQSDVVIVCVTTSEIVESLVWGDDGLLAGRQAPFLLIDCGTSNPVSTARLGKALTDAGCSMMDVPLGKSADAAEAGTLNMMAGGSEADFARARPILDCLSENLFHVGELGIGHKLKLVNNAFSMSVACLCAEVVATARHAGVDVAQLYDVMAAGPNRSGFFDWMMAAAVEGDENRLQFSLKNGFKDVGYFVEMAKASGVDCELPRAAHRVMTEVVEQGHGDDPVPSLMRHLSDRDV